MRRYLLLLFLILAKTAFAQDILGFVSEEKVAVYLLRTAESKIIDHVESSSFVYVEDSYLPMVKIKYYQMTDQAWTEGFSEKKNIHTIGNSSKGEQLRFFAPFLKKYSESWTMDEHTKSNYKFNPAIDVITQLICNGSKDLALPFLKILSHELPNINEKQIFAIEEIKDCQSEFFQTFIESLPPVTKQQLSEIID